MSLLVESCSLTNITHKKQFTWAFKHMAGIAVIKTNQAEATEQPSFALVPFNTLPVHNDRSFACSQALQT